MYVFECTYIFIYHFLTVCYKIHCTVYITSNNRVCGFFCVYDFVYDAFVA